MVLLTSDFILINMHSIEKRLILKILENSIKYRIPNLGKMLALKRCIRK
jgi:hypothetical protein